ncbi:MAG: ComEA family DNA-binding protein, partial [Gammaproteobacteria bacterium]
MKKLAFLLILLSFNAFSAPVNVNTASAQELSDALKGIGLKKAEAIIQYREANGAFKTLSDLSKVKGIG